MLHNIPSPQCSQAGVPTFVQCTCAHGNRPRLAGPKPMPLSGYQLISTKAFLLQLKYGRRNHASSLHPSRTRLSPTHNQCHCLRSGQCSTAGSTRYPKQKQSHNFHSSCFRIPSFKSKSSKSNRALPSCGFVAHTENVRRGCLGLSGAGPL